MKGKGLPSGFPIGSYNGPVPTYWGNLASEFPQIKVPLSFPVENLYPKASIVPLTLPSLEGGVVLPSDAEIGEFTLSPDGVVDLAPEPKPKPVESLYDLVVQPDVAAVWQNMEVSFQQSMTLFQQDMEAALVKYGSAPPPKPVEPAMLPTVLFKQGSKSPDMLKYAYAPPQAVDLLSAVAMYDAAAMAWVKAWLGDAESHAQGKRRWELERLSKKLNELLPPESRAYRVRCTESCSCDQYCPETCIKSGSVFVMIQHFNDAHEWSREKIADWLDTLDIDTTLQSPNPDRA